MTNLIKFDFQKFTDNIIQEIDSVRSCGSDGTVPTESRINAFYRLLGMPSLVSNTKLDRFNTGNQVPNSESSSQNSEEFGATLSYNEYKDLFNSREINFKSEITGEEVSGLLNKESLKGGILYLENGGRKRGYLFPMLVNGNIPIEPTSKRVRTAFNKESGFLEEYKRPLIETIISIRRTGTSTQTSEDLKKEFETSDALKELFVLYNLTATIESSAKEIQPFLNKVISSHSSLIKRTKSIPVIDVDNIPEQTAALVETGDDGQVEKADAAENERMAKENALLVLFEWSDFFGLKNIKDSGLINPFMSAVGIYDPTRVERSRQIKEKDEKKTKIENELRQTYRDLDCLFGTFSGISGLDVLIIMLSLLTIEEKYLFGLLNQKAQTDSGYILSSQDQSGPQISAATVEESISALHEKIRADYEKIVSDISVSAVNKRPNNPTRRQ